MSDLEDKVPTDSSNSFGRLRQDETKPICLNKQILSLKTSKWMFVVPSISLSKFAIAGSFQENTFLNVPIKASVSLFSSLADKLVEMIFFAGMGLEPQISDV